jgi:hypothetical protein
MSIQALVPIYASPSQWVQNSSLHGLCRFQYTLAQLANGTSTAFVHMCIFDY